MKYTKMYSQLIAKNTNCGVHSNWYTNIHSAVSGGAGVSDICSGDNWKAHFPKPVKSTFDENWVLTSLYRITLELVTEWNLDLDNSRKYIFF